MTVSTTVQTADLCYFPENNSRSNCALNTSQICPSDVGSRRVTRAIFEGKVHQHGLQQTSKTPYLVPPNTRALLSTKQQQCLLLGHGAGPGTSSLAQTQLSVGQRTLQYLILHHLTEDIPLEFLSSNYNIHTVE